MKHFLLIFLFTSLSLCLNAQVQKGSIGIMKNAHFIKNEVVDRDFFDPVPQVYFELPTVDYYFSKRWSVGGSFSFNRFQSVGFRLQNLRMEFRPHIKYGVNFSKFNFFVSASGHILNQKTEDNFRDINEFEGKIGTGLQWFLAENIALETWFQAPIFSEVNPFLDKDLTYTFGLKFYNHKKSKRRLSTDLFDYYLDKHNIRFGFNAQGFQVFGIKLSGFNRFQFSYENFFKDYFIFYFDYHAQNDIRESLENVRKSGVKIKLGFKTYFPFQDGSYFTLKTGLVSTNTDAFFSQVIRRSFGFDLGAGYEYFFPKTSVLKFGMDWQGTASGDFRATYSNLLPYIGLEIFLNRQISLEPRLNYFLYKGEEEFNTFQSFEIEETKERSVVFEVKFRTLIYREKGFFNKE